MNYNGFGQLYQDYQEHYGAVTGGSMLVGYSYVSGTSNTIRRTQIVYPSGYNLNYLYDSGSADDYLSRVSSLLDMDDATHLADYTYLGALDTVGVDYSGQAAINYNLGSNTGAADPYTGGFDQFDRIILDLWQPDGGGSPLVKLGYAHDLAGNRLTRQDLVAQAQSPPQNFDEAYLYDGLYRLIDFQRGQLSGGAIDPSTLNYRQNWQTAPSSSSSSSSSSSGSPASVQLDSLGNWLAFNQDTSGSGFSLTQTRTHNTSNEILSITGGGWPTPAYDNAGNTTSFPQPSNPTSGLSATYDAWNRLVSVNGVISHIYDGLNRMVQYGLGDAAIDLYYSDQWQILEAWAGTPPTIAERFVWGLRYMDDLVLRDSSTSGGGTLDQRIYTMQDAHWSVVALYDPSVPGTVERHAFDAYGNPFFLNPDFSDGSNAYTWVFLYSAYFWDPVVGLYYVRNRVYHPSLGRWLQRDPIGYDAGDMNLYAYVANGPVTRIDAIGLGFEAAVVGSFELKYNVCTGALSFGGWAWAGAGYVTTSGKWWGGAFGAWEGTVETNVGALVSCGKCSKCCTTEGAHHFSTGIAGFRQNLTTKIGGVSLGVSAGLLIEPHSLCDATLEGIVLVNVLNKIPAGAVIERVAALLGAEAQAGIQVNVSIHFCIGENGGIVADSASVAGGGYIELGWAKGHGRPGSSAQH